MTSPLFREAIERQAELREEYELLFWAQFDAAEAATNGAMLNRRGQAAGIDPLQLFRSNQATRDAYASEELREHWYRHPHVTFAAYEQQRFAS